MNARTDQASALPPLRVPRTLYDADHEAFRQMVRRFYEAELVPGMAEWEDQGMVPKSIWKRFGDVGILGAGIPENHGGSGDDFRFLAVATEEHARVGLAAPAFELHTGIVAPYLVHHGTDEQKQQWLPRLASGAVVASSV